MAYNLKKTVSYNQPLLDSNIPLPDAQNTVKKVVSNYGTIETKSKIKTDQKAYRAKVTNYKSSLKNFVSTYSHLNASYKSMKNSLTDKKALVECDEDLWQTVREINLPILLIQTYLFNFLLHRLQISLKKNLEYTYTQNLKLHSKKIISDLFLITLIHQTLI